MVWLIVIALLGMLVLRQTVLVLLATTVVLAYLLSESDHAEYAIYDFWEGLNRDALLIIPVFLLASGLLSRGSGTFRVVDLLIALARPVPGGLGIAALVSVALASALCGSPTLGLLVIGPLIYPALIKNGYPKPFSAGLLCASSVVGVLLPPSIPLALYSSVTRSEQVDLYLLAAVVAGALVLSLALWSLVAHWQVARSAWCRAELRHAFVAATPALCPVVFLFGGFYSELLSPLQSALLFLVLTLIVEWAVYRALNFRELLTVSLDVCSQLGRTLPVVAFSVSISVLLLYQQFPAQLTGELSDFDLSPGGFLIVSNLLLLLAGAAMDTVSAMLLLTPVLEPLAVGLGVDSVPFGVMMLLNLGLGYLLPPTGLVLVTGMFVFRENFTPVLLAVLPFLGLMLAILVGATAAIYSGRI